MENLIQLGEVAVMLCFGIALIFFAIALLQLFVGIFRR